MHPIFISGPHGGGKSTIIRELSKSDLFIENDFDIDFTIDFPSIASLSSFERSLVRLYHRFFVANYAHTLAKNNPDKFILTNRTVYDSEAYINVYKDLGWISESEFEKLNFVIKNFTLKPHTTILNPPLEVLKARLNKRRDVATRAMRDKIFKDEDSDDFIGKLHNQFKKFKNLPNVLYIEDNSEAEIQKIVKWAKSLK